MPLMRFTVALFAVHLAFLVGSGPGATEEKKNESKPAGITLEDIGRGLKRAAQNIENEIPKLGPAIGDTIRKMTGKDGANSSKENAQREHK